MFDQFDLFIEHVLINYRWLLVIFFLMPISLAFDVFYYTRNWIVFKLRSAPKSHEKKIRDVQRQVKEWKESGSGRQMCTARPGWQTMSFKQAPYKSSMYKINIHLVDVLEVNVEERYVRVEPAATMGQLTATLVPLGWTLPVLPEMDDLTVGGLVMGTGIETSSHKFGLFQHICLAYEIVLSDGSIVTCSKESDPDLFYSIPWSYGTLGFLLSVKIQIIPALKYVKLEYEPVTSLKEACEVFKRQTFQKGDNQFVEGLMFSKEQGVIMTGNMTSTAEEHLVNRIGRWYKPWFFKHVQTKFNDGPRTEYIPLRDYYHRHTRSYFWEVQDIISFGNHPLFRLLLGWMMPPKVSLLKLTQIPATRKQYEQKHIIQDLLVPIEHLRDSILKFDKAVQVYPLWLCPFKLKPEPGLVNSRTTKEEMYVDVGVYGVPKVANFKPVETTRDVEEFVRKVKGYQMLYADTYTTRTEFRKMFNHSLYDEVRTRLRCKEAFPEIYDKVKKNCMTVASEL